MSNELLGRSQLALQAALSSVQPVAQPVGSVCSSAEGILNERRGKLQNVMRRRRTTPGHEPEKNEASDGIFL